MKERSILMTGESVCGIIDLRKTHTRRLIKPQPCLLDSGIWYPSNIPGDFRNKTGKHYANEEHMRKGLAIDFCHYGKPGDLLWVRETWRPGAWREDGRLAIDYRASPELTNTPWVTIPDDELGEKFEKLWIKLTDELLALGLKSGEDDRFHWKPGKCPLKWRPSIFMPRWASRITLKITNVRVERLVDISPHDAVQEGFANYCQYGDPVIGGIPTLIMTKAPIQRFAEYWNKINTKRGYSWNNNPWVWVIEFEKVEG